jgi:hypothetical protein
MYMKYIKSVLQFFFILDKGKRLAHFLIVVLPLSFLVSTFFPLDTYISWIASYSSPYPTFSALWLSLQPSTFHWSAFIIAFLALIIVFSAYATLTLKCFRVGRFSIKGFFRSANDNFIAALYLVAGIAVLYLIWQFVLALFLFLCQKAPSIVWVKVFSYISLAVWSGVFLPMLMPPVMWFPLMAINGLSPAQAFGRALQKSAQKGSAIILSLAFMFLVIVAIGVISGLVGNGAFSLIFNAIAFTIGFCYFAVLNMAVYFDIEGITREDVTRSLYFSR